MIVISTMVSKQIVWFSIAAAGFTLSTGVCIVMLKKFARALRLKEQITQNNVSTVEEAIREIEEWAKSSDFQAKTCNTKEFVIRGRISTDKPMIDPISGNKLVKMVKCP